MSIHYNFSLAWGFPATGKIPGKLEFLSPGGRWILPVPGIGGNI